MTQFGREAGSELYGRTLCDIAELLESAEGAEERVRGALELLGKIVPYQQCALLDAEPGFDPRLLALPAMAPEEENELTSALVKLFGKMLEERALAPAPSPPPPRPWAAHLAVPLIGLGEVIGVLFVSRADGIYHVGNLRVLSVVAAQLAAYLMMLRVRTEEAGRAREMEEARRAASSALRAKDELVHHLLDLLSIAGLHLELGTVEPAGLIEAAIEDLRPLAEQRSIRLEAALDRSVPPVIADAGRLDKILAILLANALAVTPDGGRVEVRLEPAGEGARIQVIDSGRGFSPDHLPHMFERLGLQEDPATGWHEGFEIGLAIAKHLIELHGGSIQAESPGEGKGATFTVGLLRAPPKPLPM